MMILLFHVFDTKKEEISDKKFLTILFLFTFSSKFTLFFQFFFNLASQKLYFRSVSDYSRYIISLSLYFFLFSTLFLLLPYVKVGFLYFQLCLSLADYVCLLRLSSVMLNENKHWVYLNLNYISVRWHA